MHIRATRVLPEPTSPLYEAVHLPARHYIGAHLLYYTFLRTSQLKWQALIEEIVEPLAYARHDKAPVASAFRRLDRMSISVWI